VVQIDSHAVVNSKAELGDGVVVGPFAIIEDDVRIGENTWIGSHVYVAAGTRIGNNCKIFQGAILGNIPQDLKFKGEKTTLEIGDGTVIREYCTIHRGTMDRWKTTIGSNSFLMAYVHVAHDCQIGNGVILANAVNMGGHVVIEDFAGVGGIVPIHQFVRIGRYAFIGGGFRVPKDVPPFILAMGEPLQFGGLNVVGLRRRGFSEERLRPLRQTYRLIYRQNLNVSQALERIRSEVELTPEVKHVIEFIENSERGIIK